MQPHLLAQERHRAWQLYDGVRFNEPQRLMQQRSRDMITESQAALQNKQLPAKQRQEHVNIMENNQWSLGFYQSQYMPQYNALQKMNQVATNRRIPSSM